MEHVKFTREESELILGICQTGLATINSGSKSDKISAKKGLDLIVKLTKFFIFQDEELQKAMSELDAVIKLAEEHNQKLKNNLT